MEQELFKTININLTKLHEKSFHTRQDTLEILGVSPKTLKRYTNQGLIEPTRFRRQLYYPKTEIVKCIKKQFGLTKHVNWDEYWD